MRRPSQHLSKLTQKLHRMITSVEDLQNNLLAVVGIRQGAEFPKFHPTTVLTTMPMLGALLQPERRLSQAQAIAKTESSSQTKRYTPLRLLPQTFLVVTLSTTPLLIVSCLQLPATVRT